MVRCVIIILFACCLSKQLYSQNDTLKEYKPIEYPFITKMVSVQPGFQFGNQAIFLDINFDKIKNYRHSFSSRGLVFGFGVLTKHNIYTSSLGVVASEFLFFLGCDAALKTVHYWKPKSKGAFAIRPEIGVDIFYFYIKYGYDVFLNKKELPLKNHNFTISFNLPVYQR
jgi:hypothetical protein